MAGDYKNYYALIMAGGVGSRFWPVSRASFPKQFHDMLGTGDTLLQRTFKRMAKLIPEKQILILTNAMYNDLVKEQLPGIAQKNIVLESAMRNTAPCILLSALKVYKENPDAQMIVAPSDSWIEDETAFVQDLEMAFNASAKANTIVTLGIKPSFPNTGYGYINYEKEGINPSKKVIAFTEKPDYEAAKTFYESGNYLWNAGMFIWSARTILNAFEKHLPEMHELFNKGMSQLNTEGEQGFINEYYPQAENISIDFGVMEKHQSVEVIPASFDWNDLGTWGSLYDKLDKDEDQNATVQARTVIENATGNIIRTTQDKVVVIDGLHDYIIVEEQDILVIVPKSKEQDIKQLRNTVQSKFDSKLG